MKKQKTRLQINDKTKPDGAYGKTYVIIPAGDFIAKPIAGFNRKHAYCRPCKHVGPMMAVAPHAVNRSGGGHSVAGHAYPWAYTAELLVQDGGAEKGERRVSGGERVVVGAVGTGRFHGVLQPVGERRVDGKRRGGVDQQPLPRAAAVNAGSLHGVCRHDGHKA